MTRKWKIFIVQHSHIDIGYTGRQEEIAVSHSQFIDQAVNLALSERQEARRPDERFKFTCEGFWQVEQFWGRNDAARRERLLRAIRSGLMELSPFYLHLTELLDESHLRKSVQYADRFARQHALPLNVAMACDINGFSWAMVDALCEVGVKYLCTNINTHHGGYPFGKPLQLFRWESPKQQSLLVWSSWGYHKANLLGLMGGWQPDFDPDIPGVAIPFEKKWVDVRSPEIGNAHVNEDRLGGRMRT